MRRSWARLLLLATLAHLLLGGGGAGAQSLVLRASSPLSQVNNQVMTYDGTNAAVVSTYLGADIFYNNGIFGQNTISANVEAGVIWNGHESLNLVDSAGGPYVAPGASGEVDRHATWVGMILGGLNYSYATQTGGGMYYYQMGIAPLTYVASGAIATSWNPPAQNSDGTYPQYSTSFNTTSLAEYSAFNHFANPNSADGPVAAQFPVFYYSGVSFTTPVTTTTTANVINCSWGGIDPTGTSSDTQLIDAMARSFPKTTVVVAAGNEGSGPNTVTGPGSGYNSITVGATTTNLTVTDFTQVADFSSRGPQDYYDPVHGLVTGVRAAVSLVAPGTTLLSAYYGGATGGANPNLFAGLTTPPTPQSDTDLYSYPLAGTSFATPIVSGAVSLLNSLSYAIAGGYTWNGVSQATFPDASHNSLVIKAVLMNSADKLPGWNNGQHYDQSLGHVVTTQGLDWTQGAGQLNFTKAFYQYISGTNGVFTPGGGIVAPVGWDLNSLTLGSYNSYVINTPLSGGTTLDATLTWFRDRTVDTSDPTNPAGIDSGMANLDLQIWNATFTRLLAESRTLYDTTQELDFILPADGSYGIRVDYFGQMFGTPEAEDYGLAWADFDTIAGLPVPADLAEVPEASSLVMFCGAGIAGGVIWLLRRRNHALDAI